MQQNNEDDQIVNRQMPRKVLLVLYVPGVSDRLRVVARRYGIPVWFSYAGRLGDGFSSAYKEKAHRSKLRYSIYEAMCTCGQWYVGESYHNLKVRLAEHSNIRHSGSALSAHLCIFF